LAWIESSLPLRLARDKAALVQAVTRSCHIKASIVAADERAAGRRAILNFGHTFAHAIETGTGHGTWLHGEAVGCGMAMAADLSVRLGLIEPVHARRIATLVAAAGLPLRAPDLGSKTYLDLMRWDKKAAAGACGAPGSSVAPAPTSANFTYACAITAGPPSTYTITATGNPGTAVQGFKYSLDDANARTTVMTSPSTWPSNGTCWVLKKDGS